MGTRQRQVCTAAGTTKHARMWVVRVAEGLDAECVRGARVAEALGQEVEAEEGVVGAVLRAGKLEAVDVVAGACVCVKEKEENEGSVS